MILESGSGLWGVEEWMFGDRVEVTFDESCVCAWWTLVIFEILSDNLVNSKEVEQVKGDSDWKERNSRGATDRTIRNKKRE